MTEIARIPVVWSGLTGLPGLSLFYSTPADAPAAVAAVNTFFNTIKGSFVSGLSWTTFGSGDTIVQETGQLAGGWSGGTGGIYNASGGAGAWAAGTGGLVKWDTGGVVGGRRLRGRTFLTCILGSKYDAGGTLEDATVGSWQTAADTLVAAGKCRIWHRPHPGFADGTSLLITSATVPDRVTSLRSRRT